MSPKAKTYLIYILCFLVVFLVVFFIMRHFTDDLIWTTVVPSVIATIIAPRQYQEKTQSGINYGLKSIFSKKIIRF